MEASKYVLVTPTRDEEKTIGETIQSVTSQTIQPVEWIIVSDGSTDRTDEIIAEAQADHSWIKLMQLPPREGRCFGAVARATKIATEKLTVTDYGFMGLLDSDLRFQEDYFEKILEEFGNDPKLGLAGGVVIDVGESKTQLPDNKFDIPGAAQFFSRECFESLEDIYAIAEGGWDMLTCAEARMNGYHTKLCADLIVDHLKPRNIAEGGMLRRRWQCGERDYILGYHPLFETVKCLRRIRQRPVFFSAVAWWLGFVSATFARKERKVPSHLIDHIQKEQLSRLKRLMPSQG